MKPHVLVPILALLVGVTSSMAVPTLAQDKLQSASSYGFVLTEMVPAFHKDRDELQCPDGLAMDLMQSFLATQTPRRSYPSAETRKCGGAGEKVQG